MPRCCSLLFWSIIGIDRGELTITTTNNNNNNNHSTVRYGTVRYCTVAVLVRLFPHAIATWQERRARASLRTLEHKTMHCCMLLLAVLPSASAYQLPSVPRAVSALRHAAVRACDAPAADAEAAEATGGIISFSERALAQLETMREKEESNSLILRMGVRAGGCSGMSYVMDLEKPELVTEGDTVVELGEGMQCAIDPKSLMFLYGMQLDYSDELIGGGFSFQNPNAEETCGCGKSFGI